MNSTFPRPYVSILNQDSIKYSALTSCTYIEFVASSQSSTVVVSEGTLDDDSLLPWFEKNSCDDTTQAVDRQSSKPSHSLRILIGTCDVDTSAETPEISFSKKALLLIQDQLGLPRKYFNYMAEGHITRTKTFSCTDNGRKIQGLVFKNPFYRKSFHQISISQNMKTNISYGLILVRNAAYFLPPFLASLKSYQADPETIFEPLLLLFLAIEPEVNRTSRRLHESDSDLSRLEELMGQHEYFDRPMGDPLDLDFTAATRKLNFISKRAGVDILNLSYLMLAFETIEDQITEKRRSFEANSIQPFNSHIQQEIISLKASCRSLLLLAEYEEKRIRTLIQVVYQFMAQKDAKINIAPAASSADIARASRIDSAAMRQIAIESKKDSSAMKTIAVLGMLFLPGIFVATIFSMPVVDWDGEGGLEVQAGFGYYCAVAVPLTIIVMISWAVLMFVPWKKWLSAFRCRRQTGVHALELAEISNS